MSAVQIRKERQEELLTMVCDKMDDIFEEYWLTETKYPANNPNKTPRLVYSYTVNEICNKYGLRNAHEMSFLMNSFRKGKSIGLCKTCQQPGFAYNRTEFQASESSIWFEFPCGHNEGRRLMEERQAKAALSQQEPPKVAPQKKVEPEPQNCVTDERYETVFHGAFIQSWPYLSNGVGKDPFYIKLSEVKEMCDVDGHPDLCFFNTYKDRRYVAFCSRRDLISAINLFLFKPEEFAEIHLDY